MYALPKITLIVPTMFCYGDGNWADGAVLDFHLPHTTPTTPSYASSNTPYNYKRRRTTRKPTHCRILCGTNLCLVCQARQEAMAQVRINRAYLYEWIERRPISGHNFSNLDHRTHTTSQYLQYLRPTYNWYSFATDRSASYIYRARICGQESYPRSLILRAGDVESRVTPKALLRIKRDNSDLKRDTLLKQLEDARLERLS